MAPVSRYLVEAEALGCGADVDVLGWGAGADVELLGWGAGAVSVSVGSGSGEAEVDSLGSGSGEVVGEAVGLLVGLGFLPLPPESAGVLADTRLRDSRMAELMADEARR